MDLSNKDKSTYLNLRPKSNIILSCLPNIPSIDLSSDNSNSTSLFSARRFRKQIREGKQL